MRFNLNSDFPIPAFIVPALTQEVSSVEQYFKDNLTPSVVLGWREGIKSDAKEIFNTHQADGWDGYDAEPIKPRSLFYLLRIIDFLPENVCSPDVVPESNGALSLEWSNSVDSIISLEANPDVLVYASVIDGETKKHGQEPISNVLPKEIVALLRSHFSAPK